MNLIILLPAMGKIVGQTRLFNFFIAPIKSFPSIIEGKLLIQTC